MTRRKDLLVVAYYNGKAIVTDELDNVFYLQCDSNEAPIGTSVEESGLKPLSDLDQEERRKIEVLF